MKRKPIILLILDGFGYKIGGDNNALSIAKTPNFDTYFQQKSFGTVDASERMVGLPFGQFGNSEVGHLNIGAGRIVEQDITRIDIAIETNTLKENKVLIQLLKNTKNKLNIMGLLSDGGVHSHINHFFAILKIAIDFGIKNIVVHPFLDGRDTPPQSASNYLQQLKDFCDKNPQVSVGVIAGRFYAMDRDNRWERIEKAYNALTGTDIPYQNNDVLKAIENAYQRGETDEFVVPTLINKNAVLEDGDTIIGMNFRADRARELFLAFTKSDFNDFNRKKLVNLSQVVSITNYGNKFNIPVLFDIIDIKNTFGEYISKFGLKQLRIAETEKYAHVTYFFNGGKEEPSYNEDRILIPSPKVRTYDLKPEMSAYLITDKIIEVVNEEKYDVIICNYANADMVGHTGNLEATIKAIEVLDECVGKIVTKITEQGGEVVITADHGNCEEMYDNVNNQPHTQHTKNPVPFIYIGRKAQIKENGALKDVAPSLLTLLDLDIPIEMTGKNLIQFI